MITVTDNAIKQLEKVRADSHSPDSILRVAVIGGGCSGMSYKLDFVETEESADITFERGGIKFCIDPKSSLFLKGLEMDFSGGLNGKGFIFNNPNATKSCGCGLSFRA